MEIGISGDRNISRKDISESEELKNIFGKSMKTLNVCKGKEVKAG